LQFRSRHHVNIELKAALKTVALRHGDRLPALLDIGGEIKARSDGQLGDYNITAQQSSVAATCQAQIRARSRTYSWRITQANSLRRRAEIERKHPVLVGGRAR